jgi:hypothetical protein
LLSPRAEIQRSLACTRKRLAEGYAQAEARWHAWERLSQSAQRLRGPSLDSARERLAYTRWHVRGSSSELGERLRVLRAEHGGVGTAARELLADALLHARARSSELGMRVQAFRAEHGRASGAAGLGLLLGLALAGIGAAVLAEGGNADIIFVNHASRYVTVTGPGGTEKYAVTVTTPGKRKLVRVERTRVRRRVVTGPGGVTTVLEPVAVPGQSQTKTIAGPTKTVTGPSQTVTQAVTEVVTSVVTVTETVPKKEH